MSYQTIIFEKETSVATLTLNRPEVLNAWNMQMAEEVSAAIENAESDDSIRVVVIKGAGRGFCSGADVGFMRELAEFEDPFLDSVTGSTISGFSSMFSVTSALRNLSKPAIAAIHGVAAGAGLSLSLACDMRLAAEGTRFIMAFVRMGLIPDMGATYFLPRLVGPGMAAKLALTGDTIDAMEAGRIGMVDEVVPSADLTDRTRGLALRIAQNPTLAVTLTKQTLLRGMNQTDLESQVDYEMFIQNALRSTEDHKEAVASFLEKREPKFSGR